MNVNSFYCVSDERLPKTCLLYCIFFMYGRFGEERKKTKFTDDVASTTICNQGGGGRCLEEKISSGNGELK